MGDAFRPRSARGTFFKERRRAFALMFLAYVGFYFCRVNLPVALPRLGEAFAFSKTQTGTLLSAYFAVYAVSKLINGFIGDHIGGKRVMLVGIAGSVACNVGFGFGESLAYFIAVWSVNAYFQSMGWLAVVSICANWFASRESGKAMGLFSLSYQLGDFLARASAGMLLAYFALSAPPQTWQPAFWVHGALFALVGVLIWRALAPTPPKTSVTGSASSYRDWLGVMLSNRWFWVVVGVALCLSVIRYVFWSWSVQYLTDQGASIGTAALSSALIPLLGCLGSIFAGWVSDRMQARRGPVSVAMIVGLAVSIYVFSKIPAGQPLWSMLALGAVGFCLYGPYSLLTGTVSLDFGSIHSAASAAGIIDAVGALGSVFAGAGMGYLIGRHGWDNAFLIVIGLTLFAGALCISLWNLRPLRERAASA